MVDTACIEELDVQKPGPAGVDSLLALSYVSERMRLHNQSSGKVPLSTMTPTVTPTVTCNLGPNLRPTMTPTDIFVAIYLSVPLLRTVPG